MNRIIQTEFGRAILSNTGYYRISSSVEGNHLKLLHRLIYERFWGINLPNDIIIHHKDGNRTNNCILNLEAMTREKHGFEHNNGENHYNYSKKMSKATLKKRSLTSSRLHNTVGYYRVNKISRKQCKQGFTYRYQFSEDGKNYEVTSVNLDELKEKVIARGWEWRKLDG